MSDETGITGGDFVVAALEAWGVGTLARAMQAAREIAALLEGYAKTHHEWKPVTGNTDNSTKGAAVDDGDGLILIVLSANMDYDSFLELAHSGKYAWLWPAIVENEMAVRQILTFHLRQTGSASLIENIE